jgi:hypothetical protein
VRNKKPSNHSLVALTAEENTGILKQLLKPETFTSLSWWKELPTKTQKNVMTETLELGATFMTWGEIKHKVGQHLAVVQEQLTPFNRFDSYLKMWQKILNRSRRSLYRDIEKYEEATAFPEAVARAAAIKNFPIEKLKTVRKMLPVPRSIENEGDALKYIDAAQEYSKKYPEIHTMDIASEAVPAVDEEELLKETLVIFKNCLRRLPPRKKANWGKKVMGMQLTVMGLGHAITIEPEAVPPDYIRGRGRPAKTIEGEVQERVN